MGVVLTVGLQGQGCLPEKGCSSLPCQPLSSACTDELQGVYSSNSLPEIFDVHAQLSSSAPAPANVCKDRALARLDSSESAAAMNSKNYRHARTAELIGPCSSVVFRTIQHAQVRTVFADTVASLACAVMQMPILGHIFENCPLC